MNAIETNGEALNFYRALIALAETMDGHPWLETWGQVKKEAKWEAPLISIRHNTTRFRVLAIKERILDLAAKVRANWTAFGGGEKPAAEKPKQKDAWKAATVRLVGELLQDGDYAAALELAEKECGGVVYTSSKGVHFLTMAPMPLGGLYPESIVSAFCEDGKWHVFDAASGRAISIHDIGSKSRKGVEDKFKSLYPENEKTAAMFSAAIAGFDRCDTTASRDAWMLANGVEKPTEAPTPAAPTHEETAQQQAQAATENDRNSFTLQRLNRDTDKMDPVTFERGEYVRYRIAGNDHFGEIDGISHARREFSVDGLWYAFGFANKAERPAAPKADTVPLSSVIDKMNALHGACLTDEDRVPGQEPTGPTAPAAPMAEDTAQQAQGEIYSTRKEAIDAGERSGVNYSVVPLDNLGKNGKHRLVIGSAGQQAQPQQAQAATETVADESAYTLPTGSIDDEWRDDQKRSQEHPDFTPTPRQQRLMDEVKKVLDGGAFYCDDVVDKVAKALGVSDEVLASNRTRVQGGDFGYDVYLARRAVEVQAQEAEAAKIRAELNLRDGDKLGTLIFNDFKQTRSVEVVSITQDGRRASFKGKRGAFSVTFEATTPTVKFAIERAHEMGKRKDGYEEFIAVRAAAKQGNEKPAAQVQQAQAAINIVANCPKIQQKLEESHPPHSARSGTARGIS